VCVTLNIPKLGVGPVSVGGPTCLASKTQVRALVGGIFLVGAIGVGVIGVSDPGRLQSQGTG